MVISIELNNNKAYMSFEDRDISEYLPVLIKAERFKQLWRKTRCHGHLDVALGDETTWVNDYKYKSAEQGFSFGDKNPVPFGSINYDSYTIDEPTYKRFLFFFKKRIESIQKVIHSVSFNNGITRTIWLLCNGAKEIPFLMIDKEANDLIHHFQDDVKILNVENR